MSLGNEDKTGRQGSQIGSEESGVYAIRRDGCLIWRLIVKSVQSSMRSLGKVITNCV